MDVFGRLRLLAKALLVNPLQVQEGSTELNQVLAVERLESDKGIG